MAKRISIICNRHGYFKAERCPVCSGEASKPSPGANIITDNWVKTTKFEHIDPAKPAMQFNSKQELMAACEKTGNYAKAFMKPKSQGKGWEHRRRLI